ncbi:MAG TPA: hypothetical protein VFN41_01320, partial [Candidatus Limnocylindrales bacterium]|nr:hypothetical protein [Candidatus Limnocylindrales bacterium]
MGRRGVGEHRVRIVLLAASALALTLSVVPVTTRIAQAAGDQLRLAAAATYRVVPSSGEVRVHIDWTATNRAPDTVRRTSTQVIRTYYYYDRISFSVPAEARSIRASSGGSRLGVSVSAKRTFRDVTMRIPKLYYGQTRHYQVDFSLPGGKPRSPSDIRVGRAFTTFTAWGWGDPGLGTVRIVMPAGFDAEGYGNDVTKRVYKDRVELTSGRIADSYEWYRVILADRAPALTHAT